MLTKPKVKKEYKENPEFNKERFNKTVDKLHKKYNTTDYKNFPEPPKENYKNFGTASKYLAVGALPRSKQMMSGRPADVYVTKKELKQLKELDAHTDTYDKALKSDFKYFTGLNAR